MIPFGLRNQNVSVTSQIVIKRQFGIIIIICLHCVVGSLFGSIDAAKSGLIVKLMQVRFDSWTKTYRHTRTSTHSPILV